MRLPQFKEDKWPYLASEGYDVKSHATWQYNCIAFAADVDTKWWWPDGAGYWPPGIRREVTTKAFIEAFSSLGYRVCHSGNRQLGFDKIAIYTQNDVPTHAAKQLENGEWKSKLGPWEDIEHRTTKAVEEYIYGQVAVYMRKWQGIKQLIRSILSPSGN